MCHVLEHDWEGPSALCNAHPSNRASCRMSLFLLLVACQRLIGLSLLDKTGQTVMDLVLLLNAIFWGVKKQRDIFELLQSFDQNSVLNFLPSNFYNLVIVFAGDVSLRHFFFS